MPDSEPESGATTSPQSITPVMPQVDSMPPIRISPTVLPKPLHPARVRTASPLGESDQPATQAGEAIGPASSFASGPSGSTGGGSTLYANPGLPLSRHAPVYPEEAERRGIEGEVELLFTIRADGSSDDIQVVRSQPPGIFDTAAIRSQKTALYKPAEKNGVAVDQPNSRVIIYFKQSG